VPITDLPVVQAGKLISAQEAGARWNNYKQVTMNINKGRLPRALDQANNMRRCNVEVSWWNSGGLRWIRELGESR